MNQRTELRQHLRQQAKQKKATQDKSPEHTLVQVQIALSLLPILTACIYLFGMSRHMGYLSVFHIDSSEFPLSTEQNLLMGVVALASNVLPLVIYPIALVVTLILLGGIFALTFRQTKKCAVHIQEFASQLSNSERTHRFLKTLFKYAIRPNEAKWLGKSFEIISTWYIRFVYVFFSCAVVFGFALHSYRDGENVGKEQIAKMMKGPQSFEQHLVYAKYQEGISALRIVCNDIQCTFWTVSEGTIYLRHDQIDSVTILYNTSTSPTNKEN